MVDFAADLAVLSSKSTEELRRLSNEHHLEFIKLRMVSLRQTDLSTKTTEQMLAMCDEVAALQRCFDLLTKEKEPTMFDPIKGPANIYQGPAVGLGTEAGDTWHEAVAKVNAGFKRVISAIEGGTEAADDKARKDIAALEDAVTALQKRNDDLEAHMKGLLASFDKFLAAQPKATTDPTVPPTPPVTEAENT